MAPRAGCPPPITPRCSPFAPHRLSGEVTTVASERVGGSASYDKCCHPSRCCEILASPARAGPSFLGFLQHLECFDPGKQKRSDSEGRLHRVAEGAIPQTWGRARRGPV